AIFFHAGIWAWGGPPQTGNFVPVGEALPPGVFEGRVTRYLGKWAEVNYTINTQDDSSFYDAGRCFEDYLAGLEDFNKYDKPRRKWQDGENEFGRRRYIFGSRLFMYRSPHNRKDGQSEDIPPKTHPWLVAALKKQKHPNWILTPAVASIIDYVDGKLNMLKPVSSNYFAPGDVVWFSFALTYDLSGDTWAPDYKPLDFVRVARAVDSGRGEHSAEVDVSEAYQPLTEGNVTLLDGIPLLHYLSAR
ncbi:hypothetical protein B0H16DRAFT_1333035, partial [Mycena metata]